MKLKFTTIILAFAAFTSTAFAQIRSNNPISSTIGTQSVFLDASANGFTTTTNIGKGLTFPRTNLTTFTFVTQTTGALNFPTAYDGMIVYNSATGTTPATGSGIGNQSVTPGYYYFSNPTGGSGNAYATSTGQWLPLGQNPRVNFATTETVTNTQVDGAQVYGIKGQFTTTGTSTSVTIPAPAGMTSLYGITIYKKSGTGNKVVYSKELYSYDVTTGAAITGSQSMSVVYPQDTYDYVLEYFK
ncbi:hypothetical protein [Chryseobacterium sp. EO14]|uniref:Uncharacterized protein n=2 Tax=Chryseobacterium gambrini TaxID=373672 RepID=A0A1N7QN13_9FLAO|nr:hypothetical protein [Chryseobacterium sp. EO14]MCQ4139031.1 hypothetical protein [Chryseobacterium sp. EO14]SIT24300.1 hypothetical protein SAMN05421785_11464 [Chryseobacterium gambrini]